MLKFYAIKYIRLSDYQCVLIWKVILRDFQVQRSRSFSYTSRNIIMGSVAWTKPAAKVSSLTNWHATKMCADALRSQFVVLVSSEFHTKHNKPLWLLDTIRVLLWITQRFDFDLLCFLDFFWCPVTDENGLSSPFDNDLGSISTSLIVFDNVSYVFALWDVIQGDLHLGHGQNIL
jgi:hypothetical protein